MNDIRRTILWVIFGFSMVLLWDKWQVHNGNRGTFFPAAGARRLGPEQTSAGGFAGSRWNVSQCSHPGRNVGASGSFDA